MEDQNLSNGNPSSSNEQQIVKANDVAHKLSVVGWSLFFIWIGVSFLVEFTVGLGLLGIGVITLGIQLTRKAFDLAFEGFWFIIGLLFILGGLGQMYEVDIPLVPIVLILAGIALLYSIIKKKH